MPHEEDEARLGLQALRSGAGPAIGEMTYHTRDYG